MPTPAAPYLALLALSLCFLTACGKNSKPDTPPSLPPRVDCRQTATQDPAPPPTCAPETCPGSWVAGYRGLLGGWTEERKLRGLEQACVDRLKAAGVIR